MSFVTDFNCCGWRFGLACGIPSSAHVWFNTFRQLWILTILLLAAVLVVGIGHRFNPLIRVLRVLRYRALRSPVDDGDFHGRLCGTPRRRSKKYQVGFDPSRHHYALTVI
jgi:hypothetical protein